MASKWRHSKPVAATRAARHMYMLASYCRRPLARNPARHRPPSFLCEKPGAAFVCINANGGLRDASSTASSVVTSSTRQHLASSYGVATCEHFNQRSEAMAEARTCRRSAAGGARRRWRAIVHFRRASARRPKSWPA